jgi:hypothetical protein
LASRRDTAALQNHPFTSFITASTAASALRAWKGGVARLDLHLALGQAFFADGQADGEAYEVGILEFHAGAVVEVVESANRNRTDLNSN